MVLVFWKGLGRSFTEEGGRSVLTNEVIRESGEDMGERYIFLV